MLSTHFVTRWLGLSILLASVVGAAPAGSIEKIRNDKVLVVERTLAPGESDTRAGKNAGVLVCLDAGTLAITITGPNVTTRSLERGDGIYDAASYRAVKNVGRSPMRVVRIEFPGPGTDETWGTAGLSSNYKVIAEDRHARIYDIRIAAGASEPQHTHRDRVVVCLSGAQLEHVMPDGRRENSSLTTDDSVWRRGGTHVGRNVGQTALWAIAIEPK